MNDAKENDELMACCENCVEAQEKDGKIICDADGKTRKKQILAHTGGDANG